MHYKRLWKGRSCRSLQGFGPGWLSEWWCVSKNRQVKERRRSWGTRGDELSGVILSLRCLWNIQMETSILETWRAQNKVPMSQSIYLRAEGLRRGDWLDAHERASWKGLERDLWKRKCHRVTGEKPGGGSCGTQCGLYKARKGTKDRLSAAGEN